MKIFVQRNGVNYTAEVPDDAVCLELGSRGHHRDQPPIVAIDYGLRTYRRDGLNDLPFPERWYRMTPQPGEMVVDWHELNEPVVLATGHSPNAFDPQSEEYMEAPTPNRVVVPAPKATL